MKIIFLPEASSEFADAATYFEQEQAGLGRRFREEVDLHVRWIAENAEVPRLRSGGYRRVNLKVFPFYLAYIIQEETIWVLATAHGQRKPEYWISRRPG